MGEIIALSLGLTFFIIIIAALLVCAGSTLGYDDYETSIKIFSILVFCSLLVALTLHKNFETEIKNLNVHIGKIETENIAIKRMAIDAGLGYWEEEVAVVNKTFKIATSTSSIPAEK